MAGNTRSGLGGVVRRLFPEKRITVKSDHGTRWVRLGARQQIAKLFGVTSLTVWTAGATAFLIVGLVHNTNSRVQAERNHAMYEARLNEMAAERDLHRADAAEARAQFARALEDVSRAQERYFDAELKIAELERSTVALRDVLHDAINQREDAEAHLAALSEEIHGGADRTGPSLLERLNEAEASLAYMTDVLGDTTSARDTLENQVAEADAQIGVLERRDQLLSERTERIMSRLEEAVEVSIEPLQGIFREVGLEPDEILGVVRNDYAGQGGPLTPIALSTKGAAPDGDSLRANSILASMEEVNAYRMALEKLPFSSPIRATVRQTSGFGFRRDPFTGGRRMHSGVDWAGPHGTPIHASADGVVVFAGWQSGYGRLIKVQHVFGIETRFGHLAKINVKVGQRVSRGDIIGAMGNSGRSTGTHLHYEVRVGGVPVNPLRYIEAARDVL
ncbi:MAG: DUF5930 domain-containing protein [Pseudomonadota bacterium]